MGSIANQTAQDLSKLPSVARGEAAVVDVPQIVANTETLRGYGRPVQHADPADVDIVTWPSSGRRPVLAGTGRGGGVVTGAFDMVRRGSVAYARNHAVEREYITGWFGDPATARDDVEPADTSAILTHEANYHPDGGQIFVPRTAEPFVALLALAGDEVEPTDFRAFWCDGSFGIHIDAGVWHQPLFPAGAQLSFDDAQGAVHACVGVDFLTEFGVYLRLGLTRS
ncbi:MAG: ureidoglycolate lyase [Myxococcota bacterium]|jgi:ureidoglycolate lyase